MTYKGHKIFADVDSSERWDIDEHGEPAEWVMDYDGYSAHQLVILKDTDTGEQWIDLADDLDDAKARIDALVAGTAS